MTRDDVGLDFLDLLTLPELGLAQTLHEASHELLPLLCQLNDVVHVLRVLQHTATRLSMSFVHLADAFSQTDIHASYVGHLVQIAQHSVHFIDPEGNSRGSR